MQQCPECDKIFDESEGGCPYCGWGDPNRKTKRYYFLSELDNEDDSKQKRRKKEKR